jgi:hypothetical protein
LTTKPSALLIALGVNPALAAVARPIANAALKRIVFVIRVAPCVRAAAARTPDRCGSRQGATLASGARKTISRAILDSPALAMRQMPAARQARVRP